VVFFSLVKVWILFDGLFSLNVPLFDKGFVRPHQICSSGFTSGFLFYEVFVVNDWAFNKFNFFINFWKVAWFVIIFIVKKVVLIFVDVPSYIVHNYVWFFCWKALVLWPLIGLINLAFNAISFCLPWLFFNWRNGILWFFSLIWVCFRVWCFV
jgi:hypothetical protein